MTHVATHLMFQDGRAREAVEWYAGLVPNSRVVEVVGDDGPGQTIRFELAGTAFVAFDSPMAHDFAFTPSMSVFVTVDSGPELDAMFEQLATDGNVLMPAGDYGFSERFGWCTDRYGVSWQVSCG